MTGKRTFVEKTGLLGDMMDMMKGLGAGFKWLPFQSGTIVTKMSLLAIADELKRLGF